MIEQRGRPAERVYSVTEPGQEVLKRWVTAPIRPHSTRDELVLRAYSVWIAEPVTAAAFFREQERGHRERLALYEPKLDGMEREWGDDVRCVASPRLASYATVRRGIGHEREVADGCCWVAEGLERGTAGGTSAGAAPPEPTNGPPGTA